MEVVGQTPSIPRKGTETLHNNSKAFLEAARSDTLNSPQGDGNVAVCFASAEGISRVRHPQFPARGRKRAGRCGPGQATGCQTPSIPRKGTETHRKSLGGKPRLKNVRHPQFPARGRKQHGQGIVQGHIINVRHPQFPARGRKPILKHL